MPNCKPFAARGELEEQLRNCHLDNEAAESGQDFLLVLTKPTPSRNLRQLAGTWIYQRDLPNGIRFR
jgi:hypothetical protein